MRVVLCMHACCVVHACVLCCACMRVVLCMHACCVVHACMLCCACMRVVLCMHACCVVHACVLCCACMRVVLCMHACMCLESLYRQDFALYKFTLIIIITKALKSQANLSLLFAGKERTSEPLELKFEAKKYLCIH